MRVLSASFLVLIHFSTVISAVTVPRTYNAHPAPAHPAPAPKPPVHKAPAHQAPPPKKPAYKAPPPKAPAHKAPAYKAPPPKAPAHKAPAPKAPAPKAPAYKSPPPKNAKKPHMSVDSKGVKWSHKALPPPGACTTKSQYKPTRTMTNGELMKGGYAPRPPAGHGNPKQKPTRVGGSKAPGPKPSKYPAYPGAPPTAGSDSGNIVVMGKDGPIGFVTKSLSQWGTYTFSTDATAAEVFTKPKSAPAGFNMISTSQKLPMFGAVEGWSSYPPGNPDPAPVYASFVPVPQSVAPPTNTNNPSGLPSESNLWTIDESTGELTARWGLDSGEYVPMKIYHDVTYGDLDMARDLNEYVSYFGDIIEPVQLFFVAL